VNASKEDFREGGNLLTLWKEEYPDVLGKMITHKVSPGEAVNALSGKLKGEIKTVFDWTNG
jgi:glucose 1-dehydrogenase (EC 1.1.1.47)/galactose 1-dehydrogenase (EC 1.1.1.48)